jgi:hypothetical protein
MSRIKRMVVVAMVVMIVQQYTQLIGE